MNKNRLNLIVRMLLLPFIEETFLEKDQDIIEAIVRSYYYASNTDVSDFKKRRSYESDYEKQKKNLEEFLRFHPFMNIRSLDDALLIIELFYPTWKLATVKKEDANKKEYFSLDFYFKRLYDIAESLLTLRDGKIVIKTWLNEEDSYNKHDLFNFHDTFDKVEIWNMMSRLMVPDIVIAAFFVEAGLTEPMYLYRQNGGVLLADKTLETILRRGLAETHIHFNVGMEYTLIWNRVTNLHNWETYFQDEKAWKYRIDKSLVFESVLFRIFFSMYLMSGMFEVRKIDFQAYIKSEFKDRFTSINFIDIILILENFRLRECTKLTAYTNIYKELLRFFKELWPTANQSEDFLLDTVYYMERGVKTTSEMLFLTQALNHVKEAENEWESHLLIQYIRVKNIFFNKVFQFNSILGLRNFSKYFSSALKTSIFGENFPKPNFYREIFRSQSHNANLKKLELRLTPHFPIESSIGIPDYGQVQRQIKKDILKDLKNVFEGYLDYCQEMVDNVDDSNRMDEMFFDGTGTFPTLGIIFHFQKKNYLDNQIGDMCWAKYVLMDQNSPAYSKHLLVWRQQMINCARAIEELRCSIPYLSEYIVGIDAASKECDTEPWIMAPVYREIRNHHQTKPVIINKDMNYMFISNIGFTYHVGEEFRHILSGLRHIDEVLDHFRYKAGDRLGHAIALGADIDFWVRENEVVSLPAMEHLENLLWIWGSIVHEKLSVKLSIEELEGRIMVVAEKIFEHTLGLTPYILYEAYRKKFEHSQEDVFRECKEGLEEERVFDNSGHFCQLYNPKKSKTGVLWTKEKVLCTYYCPHHYLRYQQPMFIAVRKEETEIYKEIQRQIIKKVERAGVYVETNPTSNTAIGEISSLFQHYIMNLNSVGLEEQKEKHAILVTINSDDPVVFNTNVENELAYIYHALVHHGYGKEQILQWMDKVRQFGLDSSFVKKIKKPSQQVKEIKQILEEISDYFKHTPYEN